MTILPGYQILETIYESANSIVYRGLREQDEQYLILKVLKREYPRPEEIARYKLEYEIIQNLEIEGVIKAYGLEKYKNSLVMLLEDFGGQSLRILSDSHNFTLKDFLKIAIQIVEILGTLHQQNIIHKDINPSNIIFNPSTEQLKIIDFGISTVLSRENPTLIHPNVLEGTLAYMSPEQTGRMNRAIDYRTDFYSLGATFYELLTGQIPFDANDAMELVHCHIARQPLPPKELNPEIPEAVSNIVMQLLAKTAEERYQSTRGIQADLQLCLSQLKAGTVVSFPLGEHDFSEKLQIPQKLYGREGEVESLLNAFIRVANPSDKQEAVQPKSRIEMMLVSGYSGIGKSALVQEIYKPITQRKGYFIAGKFDQLQRNIPYDSLIQAFAELARQLLTETEKQITAWREKILRAIGNNGQVIIDVIPEVELVIGQQPDVPELAPQESQNRFNLVFQKFISVFAKPQHPLVLFLDDLQWADFASLKLLQLLMTELDNQCLLIIGTYRDNEVDASHPLMLTLDEIRKTRAVINSISLKPLDLSHVNQLICDTLKESTEKVKTLAELVFKKTNGNPFFINEFLKYLYTENLLILNNIGKWQWNLEDIQTAPMAENVVELMAEKILKLSDRTQQVLKLAACIGNQFDLSTLALCCESSLVRTEQQLWEAVQEGLIFPIGNDYKFVQAEAIDNDIKVFYQFVHDRVQQAAYSLIPEDRKQAIHLKIGQLLINHIPPEQQEDIIFDIVNQLNFGSSLIDNQELRDEVARLNLIAGEKAKASVAYQPAFSYLSHGLELLATDTWQSQYDTTLALYVGAAEAAYLCGEFEEMERLASVVLQHARVVLDKVKVYEVKISAYAAQNKMLAAIDTGLTILRLLGINLPKSPSQFDVFLGILGTKLAFIGKKVEDLRTLPKMTSVENLAAMRILSKLTAVAYFYTPNLSFLLTLRGIQLSIKNGNADSSLVLYSGYGLILCGVLRDIETGYRFGKLAVSLLDSLDAKEARAKTLHIANSHVIQWREHGRQTLKPLLEAYASAVEIGDLEYAAYTVTMYVYYSYFIGQELAFVERETAKYSEATRKFKQERSFNTINLNWQRVLNLMGRSDNPCCLMGEVYNESERLPIDIEQNNRNLLFQFYLDKLTLYYLFEEYQKALENAVVAERYSDGYAWGLPGVLFNFYDSLIRLAVYASVSKNEQKHLYRRVQANQKEMKKWSDYGPMNYLHKFYLVEAERHRILGRDVEAIDFYDKAIALAKEHEYIQEEALAHELTAKFYLAKNKEAIASVYMQNARYCYLCWGATAKVKDLDSRYPHLLQINSSFTKTSFLNNHISTSPTISENRGSEALDLATVIKASQALSGEILLDSLLAKLMKILIENAGAQKAFLILYNNSKLTIEAAVEVDSEVLLLPSIDIDSCHYLSATIVNYVARTQSDVVLNDATHEGLFTTDPYIIDNKPQSVLCSPILNQGKLIGIVYLENNLTTGVFTPDRLEVLKVISSQAAISIENALLYRTLEKKVEERTADLARANTDLEKRNALIRKIFGRYLTDEIVTNLLETPEALKLGGRRQKITILTSDLRGFTATAERFPPEEVVRTLNFYLEYMADVITKYQGTIDEFMGDGILVLFGAPTTREDDAKRAVACAVEMQLAMVAVNEKMREWGLPLLEMGIGVNTGEVVVGNIGSEKRTKYGVVGNQVNLTYRIESYTIGGQIFISESTLKEVGETVRIDGQKQVQPKGVHQPIILYEVGGIGGEYNLLLPKEEQIFFPLTEEIPVEYRILDDKHIGDTLFRGTLVELSAKGAKVRASHRESHGVLFPLYNIKINLLATSYLTEGSDDLYAKVIEKPMDNGVFSIYFTAKAPSVAARLEALYQSIQKKD